MNGAGGELDDVRGSVDGVSHPMVGGIGGYGFEEDIRVGPADLNLVYKDRYVCQPIDLQN